MKIRKLTIQNVTSYRERTVFTFENDLNILIGTNGGGKTNLQKILALTLSKYFIHQYDFKDNDNETVIELSDPWTDRVLSRTFPKHVGDDGDQLIEIELIPEHHDVENIRAIGANLDAINQRLEYWHRPYPTYDPLPYADAIAASDHFRYAIPNLKLDEPAKDTPAWAFREYLRTFFIFQRIAVDIPGLALSSPVFFFASDRTLDRKFDIQAGSLSEQQFHQGFRSAYQAAMGQSMNLMQWGTQHFVRIHRWAFIQAGKVKGKTWEDFFWDQPDVMLLTRYLRQLGYKWGFASDPDQLTFQFRLVRGAAELSPDMFSSGEREIVHFLLALFALNVKDGLVLVDEPELHLHPRWQKIFLGLFRDLAPERSNQFIITTHSPVFVTPDTINSITRVFRGPTGGSSRVALRDVDLPEKRNLVRMINSQNNERLFFADKVVLVEGISDRLVLTSLLDGAARKFGDSSAIEIIEVGGKGNFAHYHTILDGLKTPSFVVADRDYLWNVGAEQTRTLFASDLDKMWEVLTRDKRSTDRVAMIGHLRNAINGINLEDLKKFHAYFESRFGALKDPLSNEERDIIEHDIARLAASGTFVLRYGEIEDYLPPGVVDIRGIVEMTIDRDWINRVSAPERRVDLGQIVCAILGIRGQERESFVAELIAGKVGFPAALADEEPHQRVAV